ncbi:unnamed protein product (mitochondrion) [Plasmodiophora brassicae]|uniref:Tyrosine--tRNA ligase n=1 Tax=Plasmodiophora brassicae TaxID=37360 RepID=A0A0G4J885_PLABS|nr:hypothetical protein PBRA_003314 [Plasmodiophora brassicae]SPQ99670.1 unnamed protein product [Plasmodiophora brassicae]
MVTMMMRWIGVHRAVGRRLRCRRSFAECRATPSPLFTDDDANPEMLGRAPPEGPCVITDLENRECLQDCANRLNLERWLKSESRCFYSGFDPTAESLHLGNMMVLMAMRRLQDAGHTPIVVIGGATALIGDPSGRDSERPFLDPDQVERNVDSIRADVARVLDCSPDVSNRAMVVNNIDWYENMNIIQFMRNIAKHFKLQQMLTKDSVRSRLDNQTGMTLTEFLYQTLQAYDFLYLAAQHNCLLQIGGSDQWGNITAGINLIRKRLDQDVYGLTVPLMLSSSGMKIGKSTGGNGVWLSPDKTTPFQLYQSLLNTPDADVRKMLRWVSLVPLAQIDDPTLRPIEAQQLLAESVTRMVHGEQGVEKAKRTTQILFDGDIDKLPFEEIRNGIPGIPELKLAEADRYNVSLVDLVCRALPDETRSSARRLIKAGAVTVNGCVPKEGKPLQPHGNAFILRIGKHRHALIRMVAD